MARIVPLLVRGRNDGYMGEAMFNGCKNRVDEWMGIIHSCALESKNPWYSREMILTRRAADSMRFFMMATTTLPVRSIYYPGSHVHLLAVYQ